MTSMSSPMASTSSAAATPSYGLPAMPGSYEDFEFSLNLPENISASDFSLVASPDFGNLFGLPSGPISSSLFSSGMTPPPQHASHSSSSFHAHTDQRSSPSSTTPRATDADDTVMTHSLSSNAGDDKEDKGNPDPSNNTGKDQASNGRNAINISHQSVETGSSSSSSSIRAPQIPTPFASSVLGLEPQPTSLPTSSVLSNPSSSTPFPLPQAGPSFQQFQMQPGQHIQGFHPPPQGQGSFLPPQQQMHQQQYLQHLLMQQQQQLFNTQQHQQHQPQPAQSSARNPSALFDANETNFLTNFLSGFEGWDFNPNLPMDLPSFADAEKLAYPAGTPPSSAMMAGGNEARRNSRQRSAGGVVRNAANATTAKGSPHMHHQFTAATGNMSPKNASGAMGGADGMASDKKKLKMGHNRGSGSGLTDNKSMIKPNEEGRETETDKRSNHILSEQRRRNHIREAFKELVDLLEAGREFGARGLGLSSGAGTGIEDEGLDDRSDYETTLEDEEPSATTKRRKQKMRKRAAIEAARKAGQRDPAATAALINGGASGGRGKGRGRGGSAGGGAGSKSAVLFQAVDLLHWLDGRNAVLTDHVKELEHAIAQTT